MVKKKGVPPEVQEKVNVIIEEMLGVDAEEVTPQADIVADLNADELDVVELIMNMEDEFRIEISDDDAEKVHTPKQMGELVYRLLTEKEEKAAVAAAAKGGVRKR